MVPIFTASRTLYHLDRDRDEGGRTVIDHGDGSRSTSFESFEPVYHLYRDCPGLAGVAIAQIEEGWMPIQTICEACEERGRGDLIAVVAAHDDYAGLPICVFPDVASATAFVDMTIDPGEEDEAEHLSELRYEPKQMSRVELAQLGEWEP